MLGFPQRPLGMGLLAFSAWRDRLGLGGDRLGLDKLWLEFLPLARGDVLLASLVLNITALALPLVVLQVYDRIIPYAAIDTLSLLVSGLLVALVLDSILRATRSYIAGWAGARFEHAAGVRAVDHILKSDLASIEAMPAGVHLDRLSSIDPVRDFYASQASLVLVDLPFAILFLGLLGLIAGSLVIVPMLLMLIFVVIALLVGDKLREALAMRAKLDDRRYNFVIEVLSGIRTIKGLAMERLMQRRYDRLMESCATSGYRVGYLSSLAQSIGSGFSEITMVAVAAVGSLYVIDGRITVGALAACTLLAGRTVQPVLRALGIWTRFQSIRIAETRLGEIEAMPQERQPQAQGAGRDEPIERLSLDQVVLGFKGRTEPLLNQVSLEASRGRIVAIKGRNGVGKSSLLWALMGGIDFAAGTLKINGAPASQFDLAALRRQFAYLPQWPALFQGTVLENLTGFGPEALQTEALRLAAALGLDAVFAKLPDGYETLLGNGSSNAVAAGVSQRIAIVRALVRRPRVILFDEANTALDMEADERLKRLILAAREDMAIVLVSHRPSLLATADEVFELADGQLRRQDSPEKPARKGKA